jgi:hypothetical protein
MRRQEATELTVSQAGKIGGLETLRRHSRAHFAEAGRKGQAALARKYTHEDRVRWAKLGGRPRKARYVGEKG